MEGWIIAPPQPANNAKPAFDKNPLAKTCDKPSPKRRYFLAPRLYPLRAIIAKLDRPVAHFADRRYFRKQR